MPYVPGSLGAEPSQDADPGVGLQPGEGSGRWPPGTPGTGSQCTAVEVVEQLAIEGPAVDTTAKETEVGSMLPPQGLPMALAPRASDARPDFSETRRDGGQQQFVHSPRSNVQIAQASFRGHPVDAVESSETQFELIRMRSLVEHLADRIERFEGERPGSFGSASSGRLGWVDHVALDRELARQSQFRELEAFNQRGMESSTNGLLGQARGSGLQHRLDLPSWNPSSLPVFRSLAQQLDHLICLVHLHLLVYHPFTAGQKEAEARSTSQCPLGPKVVGCRE